MLRSSEIKPLFVDLSLSDKSFSFLCIPHSRYLHAAHTAWFFDAITRGVLLSTHYFILLLFFSAVVVYKAFSPVVVYKYNYNNRPHPYSSVLRYVWCMMYVCMYLSMYVSMYVSIYVCIYVSMYVCIYVYICLTSDIN